MGEVLRVSREAGIAINHAAILAQKDGTEKQNRPSPLSNRPNVGEWVVVVQYADWMACARAQESFADDPEHTQVVTEISENRDIDQT